MKLFKYLTFALFPILAACGRESTFEWKEEVQLQDGRVIVVTQKRRYERVYDGQSTGNLARSASLSFSLPETGNQTVEWQQHLMPRVLGIHQGKLYIVGFPPTYREFIEYGKIKAGWIGYVLNGSQWEQIPFEQIPTEIYDTNLLIDWSVDLPKLVTLAEKNSKQMNGDHRYRGHIKRIDPTHNFEWQ